MLAASGGFHRKRPEGRDPAGGSLEVRPRWAALRTHPEGPIGSHRSDPALSMRLARARWKGRRSRSSANLVGGFSRTRWFSHSHLGKRLARACEQNGAASPRDAAPSLRLTERWAPGDVERAARRPGDRLDGVERSRGFAPGSVPPPIRPSRSGRGVRAGVRAGADRAKPSFRLRTGPRRACSSGSHAALRDRHWW
jgi:hypothetical protein